MAVFEEISCVGEVRQTLIVPEGTDAKTTIASEPTDGPVPVSFEGFPGEVHAGLTRPSCVRVKDIYEEGTPIRNTRQISIVSEEEMVLVAEGMEIDAIKPEWLGANLLISGIPHFTLLPPSTRLLFSGGACLIVDVENQPCAFPAKEIEKEHEGKGKLFIRNSRQRRGVVAGVEREGTISVGNNIRVFVPTQPAWPGND